MKPTKNHLKNILARQEWTEEDKQWMLEFLESKDAPMLKEVMADEFVPAIMESDEPHTGIPDELLTRIHERMGAGKKTEKKIIPLWSRRLAAASVILIVMTGIFYFLTNTKQESKIAGTKTTELYNDALPGGNKAVLTLGDGTTIILDSMENGMLTQQGNSKIVKLHDGQVAYQPSVTNDQQTAIQYNSVTTPRGGQYRLILADGTRVWLNAASSIRFPTAFTGTARAVEVTGEAYFEVAHNAELPFTVKASDIDIRVLGTHFNINAYADEASAKVTLLEGSVEVVRGNANKVIVPGEQAIINSGVEGITVKSGIDSEGVIAWKNGYFSFSNTDIRSLMRQISRWYNVEVVFEGEPTDERFVGEVSRNSNVSEILKILELSNVHSRVENGKIIIER